MNDPLWMEKPDGTGGYWLKWVSSGLVESIEITDSNIEHWSRKSLYWMKQPTPAVYLALVKCAEACRLTMEENLDLADGDVCTLMWIKQALAAYDAAREASK